MLLGKIFFRFSPLKKAGKDFLPNLRPLQHRTQPELHPEPEVLRL